VNILLLVLERCDVIGGDHIAFHADHLGNLDNATLTIAHAFCLHDDIQRSDDLRSNRPRGQIYLSHLHHVFDTGQGVAAVLACTVEIEPSWPVFIACSNVKRLSAAHLAYDDPVRRMRRAFHTRSALCHLPRAFEAGEGRVSKLITCGC